MTFYQDDSVDIQHVDATGYWVLILNGIGVKDAKREKTLQDFVSNNSVNWERPLAA